jgi:hypothetical protein
LRRLIIIYLLAVFPVLTYPAAGAETKEKEQETQKSLKNWSLSVKGGLTLNAGNSESLLVNGGVRFQLRSGVFEYATSVETFYGFGKDQQTVNKGEWLNKLSRGIGKRWDLYAKTALEYDKFSDIGLRIGTGLGIQYRISDTSRTTARMGSTIKGEFTNAFDILDHIDSLRWDVDFSIKQTITPSTNYSVDTLFTSNMKDFFGDFRVETRASISAAINKKLSLRVEITDKYTHRPAAEGIKKNDFTLVTSLEVTI